MQLFGPYDDNNILAKILRGDIPSVRVHEDDLTVTIMDLFPQSRGHMLVVPKGVSARTFLDFPPDRIGPYFQRVQEIAKAAVNALMCDGVTIMQFNGTAGGQTIFHLHVHVVPRWEGRPLTGHNAGAKADATELEAIAKQIAAAM